MTLAEAIWRCLYNYVGIVTVTNSLIASNSVFTHEGGIFQYRGTLKVTNTTIYGTHVIVT